MAVNRGDYGQLLGQLLPPGSAWDLEPDSNLNQLLEGLGTSLSRLHNRALNLYDETGATEAYETLTRWETALGLPDSCSLQGSLTVQERIGAVISKLLSQGGISRGDFLRQASAMGYPGATITEFWSRRHGRARMGEAYGGDDWEDAWQFNLPASLVIERKHGRSAMGERYRVWGDAEFECLMQKRKPAGSILFFTYGG